MDLKKSKSLENTEFCRQILRRDRNGHCFYFDDHRSQSESSLDPCIIVDDRSEVSSLAEDKLDSGDDVDDLDKKLSKVETKIDKLNKMLQEQLGLVLTIREDLSDYKSEQLGRVTVKQEVDYELDGSKNCCQSFEHVMRMLDVTETDGNDRAKMLLDAIELKHLQRIDFQIKDSISKFLQSDELKTHLASATVGSLKNVIKNCFSEIFSKAYLPILENSYRRLFKSVTKILHSAFRELETNSISLFKSPHKTTSLRSAIEKHQMLLETTKPADHVFQNLQGILEEILQNELKEWRGKLLEVLKTELQSRYEDYEDLTDEDPPHTPTSPPQPADPQISIIHQLMKSAEIKKHVIAGNINKAFEMALLSSDLSLVMAACRAADPQTVFADPCLLHQSVLLSLVQQLVTDMVHDTQLKCRYLEDAIIKLNKCELVTRAHLPLVVHEVRKHLTRFLHLYPSHVASRRITLIVMATSNLIE